MMNCQNFQDQMFDYLDGSLPVSRRAAAEAHLTECTACRQTVQSQRDLAARFQREMDALVFRPEFKRRIEDALLNLASAEPAWKSPIRQVWKPALRGLGRFAWPVAVAAAVLIAAGLSFYARVRRRDNAQTPVPALISVHFSSCEPAYIFRRKKNMVMDALTCVPCVVEENYSLSLNQKNIPRTKERNKAL